MWASAPNKAVRPLPCPRDRLELGVQGLKSKRSPEPYGLIIHQNSDNIMHFHLLSLKYM